MVDQLEADATDAEARKRNILAIAHSEDVIQWAATITQWLQVSPTNQIHFIDLCQSVGLSRVEVWLGVLFGRFELQPEGEFYSDALWVKRTSDGA